MKKLDQSLVTTIKSKGKFDVSSLLTKTEEMNEQLKKRNEESERKLNKGKKRLCKENWILD